MTLNKVKTTSTSLGAINVKDYGAKGDGVADDTAAIQNAINYVNSLSRKPVIKFPIGEYKVTSPITLYSHIRLSGEDVKSSEFQQNVQITTKSSATSTFLYPSGDLNNIVLSNIEFYAHLSATLFPTQNHGSGLILKYSSIFNCGFNFYDQVFDGRWLGVRFYENNVNNGNRVFNIAGSDNTIRDNFLTVIPSTTNVDTVVVFDAMSLSRFERNFITGIKAKCMVLTNSPRNTILNNWFDISDSVGIYGTGSNGNSIIGNTFNKLCAAPYAQYESQITLFDCSRISIIGNMFSDQENVAGRSISLRKSTTGCDDIKIIGNTFENFKINAPTGESTNVQIESSLDQVFASKLANGASFRGDWNNSGYWGIGSTGAADNTLIMGSVSSGDKVSYTGNAFTLKLNNGSLDAVNIAKKVVNYPEAVLTTTSVTNIISYTPSAIGHFEVKIYAQVITAATNLTIQVAYNDGTVQTQTIQASASKAVGSYTYTPLVFRALTTTPIVVKVTAGTANQAYISASLWAV